jgi:hypothetical protein
MRFATKNGHNFSPENIQRRNFGDPAIPHEQRLKDEINFHLI